MGYIPGTCITSYVINTCMDGIGIKIIIILNVKLTYAGKAINLYIIAQ